jgi:putative endonuclease
MREYYVYVMASRGRTLYIGVTNDLSRRVFEHKEGLTGGFIAKYKITKLVYFENTNDVRAAIEREKQIKASRRSKKVALVESANSEWKDLSLRWYDRNSHA